MNSAQIQRVMVFIVATAMMVGLVLYNLYSRSARDEIIVIKRPIGESSVPGANPPQLAASIAMKYATALKERRCDDVIALTAWMQARLDHVRLGASEPEQLAREKQVLCSELVQTTVENNQLRSEGIEDQYVFAPGTTIESVLTDSGRIDLSQPISEREWLKVTFPMASRALRDKDGRPIRSIVVGVNVSLESRVVKAGIVGNLDIDWTSINLNWEKAK